MQRSIELEQPSDSDEEEYEEMSTQKLKKIIDEGGLSQTTTTQLLGIFVKKVDERDAKLGTFVKAYNVICNNKLCL